MAALLDGDDEWLPFEGGTFWRGFAVGSYLVVVIVVIVAVAIGLASLLRFVAAGLQP